MSRRRSEPEIPDAAAESLSDAEMGEMHASSGRFGDAAQAYERALSQSPNNELLRERLEELRALARPVGKADMESAEKLAPLTTPPRGVAPVRSAKASEATFAPMKAVAAPAKQPKNPVELLKALLERVRAGRRKN